MILNKGNILHIQEPYNDNNKYIWIDIYTVAGILKLGFTYNQLIEKLLISKAWDLYKGLETKMTDSSSCFTLSKAFFDQIEFLNLYNVENFVIRSSAKK